MLTIVHAADLHLDSPFDALPPDRAKARREEQRDLLCRLAELAEDRRADLVLLSGDLLDGQQTYYETSGALLRVLGGIAAPVFLAPGNHDFYSNRSPYATLCLPPNVHIFKTEALEAVALPELHCVVHGCAFTGPYRDDDPLRGFMAEEDGQIHLGVVHGDVGAQGRYAPVDEASLAVSGLSYVALGHVHTCSGLQKAGSTCWAYPGCPEGRGFDETGEKGALVVTVGETVAAEFVPLCARKYEILTVEVTGEDPAEALTRALPQNAQADIYRILLTGESDVAGLDLAALRRLAEPYFYSVSLRDQTRVKQDIWRRAEEESLTGSFLREMRGRIAAAPEDRRPVLERAVRFGLAALEHREVPLG